MMYYMVLCALVAAVVANPPTTTQQAPTEPPFTCVGRPEGRYAPPAEDCPNFFYLCKNDHTYTTHCPSNKFYHVKSETCQLRPIACPPPTTTTTTTTTTQQAPTEPPFTCVGRPEGRYAPPAEECPRFFYLCKNDHTYTTSCPANKFYHVKSETCQLREIACPPPTTTTTTTQQSPTEPPFSCIGRSLGYYLPEGVLCSRVFYLCKNDHTYTNTCPEGKFWDAKSATCEVEKIACALPTTTQATPPEFSCEGRKDGSYHPDDGVSCSNFFYMCRKGDRIVTSCPEHKRFHASSATCQLPIIACKQQ